MLQYTIYFDTSKLRDGGDKATHISKFGRFYQQKKTITTTYWDTFNSVFNNNAMFITTVGQGIYDKITNTLVTCGIFKNDMNLQVRGGHYNNIKIKKWQYGCDVHVKYEGHLIR